MRYMIYIHSSGATLRSLKRGNLQTSFLPHLTSAWDIPLSWGMSIIIRVPEKQFIGISTEVLTLPHSWSD